MFDIFGQIKAFIKSTSVRIDNNVFTFHYRGTVLILMAFSLIISSRKYFGDPIDCTASVGTIERIVDNFCWFHSYIIVPRDPESGYVAGMEEHNRFKPVISNGNSLEKLADPNNLYRAYFLHAYQWIEFILFLQAVLFFIPRYLWRYCWEQGRVKALTEGFSLVTLKQDDDKQKYVDVVRYIRRNKFDHFEYAWKYIVCEVLNFVNVLAQFFILRSTMGISWSVLLHDFLNSDSNIDPESPLNLIFPNLARCEVPVGTGSSHVNSHELCVLPVNVFTTKMYIFLWFYFAGLSVVTGISLIYRFATILSSQFRCFLMKRAGVAITDDCTRAIRSLGYGEWFLLSLVGKNMDPFSYKNLIKEYSDNLMESRPSFSLIGTDKIYNADLAAMRNIKKDSEK